MVALATPIFGQPVKGSVFGSSPTLGFTDPGTGQQASGLPLEYPGIALGIPRSDPAFGGWYNVTFPSGQTYTLQQTDVGPAAWTGKTVDINPGAAALAGYTQANFPTGPGFSVSPTTAPASGQPGLVTDGVSTGTGGDTLSVDPNAFNPGAFLIPGTDIPIADQAGVVNQGTIGSASVFCALTGMCGPSGGQTGLPGPAGAFPSTAGSGVGGNIFTQLGTDIADFATRAALVLLAIVLIAAAAWALAHGEGAARGLQAIVPRRA
jgi:hypothetical protein